jgi:hypothetical protein
MNIELLESDYVHCIPHIKLINDFKKLLFDIYKSRIQDVSEAYNTIGLSGALQTLYHLDFQIIGIKDAINMMCPFTDASMFAMKLLSHINKRESNYINLRHKRSQS